jgi:hypothetical protein
MIIDPARFFIIAATLNFTAALLHLAVIIGGPDWYRFFGAGEKMARMAEAGLWQPTLVTIGIATVLSVWGLYALAGAGIIRPLPLMKPALTAITAVYLLRGLAPLPLLFLTAIPMTPFVWWSSAICLTIGLIHLAGLIPAWDGL